MKKLIFTTFLAILCQSAHAEDLSAEITASEDLSADSQNSMTANFAFICHLRDFDWVSAVNSMVLERANRDIEALKLAGDTSGDVRIEWEIIARSMTLYWTPEMTYCDSIKTDVSNLDALAVEGGYNSNP